MNKWFSEKPTEHGYYWIIDKVYLGIEAHVRSLGSKPRRILTYAEMAYLNRDGTLYRTVFTIDFKKKSKKGILNSTPSLSVIESGHVWRWCKVKEPPKISDPK